MPSAFDLDCDIIMSQVYLYLKKNKQQFLHLLFVLLLIGFVHLVVWQIITDTVLYNYCTGIFSLFTAKLTIFLSDQLGQHTIYLQNTGQLCDNVNIVTLVMPNASYEFYFVGFLLLFFVPRKYYIFSLLIILISLFYLAFRAAAISIIQLLYLQDMILLLWIDPLIYIPMFVIILFVLNKNPKLKPLYDKIIALFRPFLSVSLPNLILILLLVTPLPRVILNYVDRSLIDELTNATLIISKTLMSWFGYDTIVSSKFIFLGKFWLRLEQPCLGIGVATIVTILVTAVKSRWVNKVLFLIVFYLLFILMNSIRLSVLLLAIKHTYSSGINKIELHNNITYFMYFFAFISFFIYYFWFQDIEISKSNKKKNLRPQ